MSSVSKIGKRNCKSFLIEKANQKQSKITTNLGNRTITGHRKDALRPRRGNQSNL